MFKCTGNSFLSGALITLRTTGKELEEMEGKGKRKIRKNQ